MTKGRIDRSNRGRVGAVMGFGISLIAIVKSATLELSAVYQLTQKLLSNITDLNSISNDKDTRTILCWKLLTNFRIGL